MSMKFKRALSAVLWGFASVAMLAADDGASMRGFGAGAAFHGKKPDPANTVKIERPKFGQVVKTESFEAIVDVGKEINAKTLRVTLNGKDITSALERDRRFGIFDFDRDRRFGMDCEVKVKLSPADGLVQGRNRFSVSGVGNRKRIETAKVIFDYDTDSGGVGDSQTGAPYLPMSVGFTLNAGGNMPWVTITTGYPAGVTDRSTRPSTPFLTPTFRFPSSDLACSGTALQVLVMDRHLPNQMVTFKCIADQAGLTSYLSSLQPAANTSSQYLVIVGTTPSGRAPGQFRHFAHRRDEVFRHTLQSLSPRLRCDRSARSVHRQCFRKLLDQFGSALAICGFCDRGTYPGRKPELQLSSWSEQHLSGFSE